MGYPNVIYGDYGDEKVAQSIAIGNLPLGQLMILPDGRKFRHAQCGSADALEAGAILSTSAGLAGDGNIASSGLIASATTSRNAAGHTDVYVATSLTAFTKDQFADGFLNVQGPAASTYIGQVYKVKSNIAAASVAAAGDLKVSLYETDPLQVAFAAGSTTVSLRKSPYKDAIVYHAGTVIAPPMGVSPTAVSASFYFWAQRGGECSIQQGATVAVDGARITCASAEAGSASLITTADTGTVVAAYVVETELGYALEAAAASEAVLSQVNLE